MALPIGEENIMSGSRVGGAVHQPETTGPLLPILIADYRHGVPKIDDPSPVRTNAPQRVNAIGGGRAIVVDDVTSVERHNIEAAAREGYLDALADRGFSLSYDDAPAPWQRNYEIGRLWGAGIKVCGIEAPAWPVATARQPPEVTRAVEEVGRRIGALRPEIEGIKAPADDLPVLHSGMKLMRRRR